MVPVLPAIGQPICAAVPVPRCALASIALTASDVCPSVKTLIRRGLPSDLSTLPSGKTTFVIAIGLTREPPLLIVTKARVISSGETPRVRPPRPSAG